MVGAAQAGDVIVGAVAAVRGDVFREVGAARERLGPRAPIHRGDVIVTASGKARLDLNDGSIITVGENSRVRIADYQSIANRLRTRLDLGLGVLRLLVGRRLSGAQFEVDTETAVAAVRGTDWLVEASPGQTSVALVTGEVEVTARDAPSPATVRLEKPGQGTDVRRGVPPAVTSWGAARFAATLARATFE
jgi:hypothetical protein